MAHRDAESNTDNSLAIIGVTFSILLTVYLHLTTHNFVYDMSGILSASAFAAWLMLKRSAALDKIVVFRGRTFFLVSLLAFTALLLISSLIVWMRPDQYERPTTYFVAISLMAGIIGIESVFVQLNKRRIVLILIQTIALGASLALTEVLIFPTVIGIDPWWHQMFTLKIIDAGHVPSGFYYASYPIFHINIASFSLVSDTSYRISSLLSTSLAQTIVVTLFVFLVGRLLGRDRVGLLAGLCVVIANRVVFTSFWIEPITFAGILTTIIMYTLFRGRESKRSNSYVLVTICAMFTLILTHPLAALFVALALISSWAVYSYASMTNGAPRFIQQMPHDLILLFFVGMLAAWTIVSEAMTALVDLIEFGFRREYFLKAPDQVILYSTSVPLSEQMFNNLGLMIFFALAILGCLYFFSTKYRSPLGRSVAVFSLIPLGLSYFSLILGGGIVESRWLYLAQIWLSLPVAVAVLLVVYRLKGKLGRHILVAGLAFGITFLMIMSSSANIDNRTFSEESGVRSALTESELVAGKAAKEIAAGQLESDSFFASGLTYLGTNVTGIDKTIIEDDFLRVDGNVILLREEVVNHPFFLLSALPWKLDYDIEGSLDAREFDRVYDSGSVMGYS